MDKLVNICFTCLNTYKNLLVDINAENEEEISYFKKLKLCLPQIVSGADYAQKCSICILCAEKIDEFYKFYDNCLVNRCILEELVNGSESDYTESSFESESTDELSFDEDKSDSTGYIMVNNGQSMNLRDFTENSSSLNSDDTKLNENTFKIVQKRVESMENDVNEPLVEGFQIINNENIVSSIFPVPETINSDSNDVVPLESVETKAKYECYSCGKGYNTLGQLNTHIKVIHSPDRSHLCYVCKKTFGAKIRLLKHLKLHKNHFSHECKRCTLLFHNQNDLLIHRNTTECCSKIRSFTCNHCPEFFTQYYNLQLHKRRCHHEQVKFACEKCCIDFQTSNELAEHENIHESNQQPSNDLRFDCEACKTTYKTRSELQTHFLSHNGEKLYKCSVCLKRFVTENELSKHVCDNHMDGNKNVCYLCGKTYVYENSLRNHILSVHSDENKCYCNVCIKEHIAVVKASENKKYSDYKVFKCKYCERRFLRDFNLEKHMATHLQTLSDDFSTK